MKKVFVICLTLLLVFSLVGCGGGGNNIKKEALQALYAASAAQLPDDSGNAQFDIDFTMDMATDFSGVSMDVGFGGNMKAIYENNVMTQMLFAGKISMGGMGTYDMAMFIGSDGKYYTSVMGTTTVAEGAQFDNLLMADDTITEDYIKSAEKKTNSDGSTTYVIVVDGKALSNSQTLKDQLAQSNVDGSLGIDDVTYEITIGKDGKPVNANLDMEITTTIDGESSTVTMKVDITYNSFENVVIDVTPYE